jgi:cystathionine beta-lyase/cystathionine gamma-synthase
VDEKKRTLGVKMKKMEFETKAIHVGQKPDPSTGAVIVPIYQTSTYVQEKIGKHKGYEYSRTANPTRKALEDCLASLEEARFGLAFGSGMAAISTVLSLLKSGDHILCSDDVYGGTYRVFEQVYKDYGLEFSYVDSTKISEIERNLRKNTRLLWVETPSNPLMHLTDLKKVSQLTKKRGIILAVDNTVATPYFQKPLLLGTDLVIHSTTKYLGGHSDVVGGAILVSNPKLYERLKFCQNAVGGVPGAFDCWLVLRGLKTLAVRMEKHQGNALKVAKFLESHPKVKKVLYPGLLSHPQHLLAKKQMSGFSSLLSFEIKGDLKKAKRVCESCKIFCLAESLGGVESLIEHPALMTHSSIPKKIREKRGVGDNLIRISVGIENSKDLIEDLKQSLGKI